MNQQTSKSYSVVSCCSHTSSSTLHSLIVARGNDSLCGCAHCLNVQLGLLMRQRQDPSSGYTVATLYWISKGSFKLSFPFRVPKQSVRRPFPLIVVGRYFCEAAVVHFPG